MSSVPWTHKTIWKHNANETNKKRQAAHITTVKDHTNAAGLTTYWVHCSTCGDSRETINPAHASQLANEHSETPRKTGEIFNTGKA